jgi:GTP-binding protein HflX
MSTVRETKRQERVRNEVPSVAIAGYTNAGKSSLLNRLTGAGVLVENALFATLDPTVRRARTTDGREFTLSDTVGFVRHLPHQLVEAFRSTLEEVSGSDVILHIVDGANPDPIAQVNAVREVLADIEAASVHELIVVNKIDAASEETLHLLRRALPGALFISARTGEGIDGLIEQLDLLVPRAERELRACVPYDKGGLVSRVHEQGEVLAEEHTPDGTAMHVRVGAGLARELEPYLQG